MATVLLVCAAGVSGTFLGRRMRDVDPDLVCVVTGLDSLASALPSADAVLVAPQLASSLDAVRRAAAPVPVALLPATAFAVGGAEAAVMQARHVLASHAYRGAPTPESKE
ncbi:MAG: hypothetical protein JWR33_353 [Naasia sp.]|uniref:PTS sugar transporter subunit IIB n=1 Tax=Naasia sp. TaxID=2546198 RepID=UPI0026032FDA|nr:hypothetical protein [Naasia sp.]MCU1569612.1 hypothetical protein [Naasia sp.]